MGYIPILTLWAASIAQTLVYWFLVQTTRTILGSTVTPVYVGNDGYFEMEMLADLILFGSMASMVCTAIFLTLCCCHLVSRMQREVPNSDMPLDYQRKYPRYTSILETAQVGQAAYNVCSMANGLNFLTI